MICSREYVIKKLTELLAKPQKKYSQNFLVDYDVVKSSIDALSLAEEDEVIEIGPGLGALSEEIINRNHVLNAFEIDAVMCEHLTSTFKNNPKFKLYHGDFLKQDLIFLNDKSLCVISNLPYNLTTPIIEKIIMSPLNIKSFVFMIQKEVTERIFAKINTKEYSPLSIMINYLGKVSLVCRVGKDKFIPSPNVDSVVLSLVFKQDRDYQLEKKLYSLLKASFNMRRKTILNNLVTFFSSKDKALEVLNLVKINPTLRPEQLSIDDYLKIVSII